MVVWVKNVLNTCKINFNHHVTGKWTYYVRTYLEPNLSETLHPLTTQSQGSWYWCRETTQLWFFYRIPRSLVRSRRNTRIACMAVETEAESMTGSVPREYTQPQTHLFDRQEKFIQARRRRKCSRRCQNSRVFSQTQRGIPVQNNVPGPYLCGGNHSQKRLYRLRAAVTVTSMYAVNLLNSQL